MDFLQAVERLRIELGKELPGAEVQQRMASSVRDADFDTIVKYPLKRNSGVLILLYPHTETKEIYTVFIQRALYSGPHSGQVGFPGGKYELADKNLIQTAIRESVEEIGINHDDIIILGTLTSLYIPISNITVLPVVGWTETQPVFKKDDNEVESIIEIPLSYLLSPQNRFIKKLQVNSIEIEAPCFMAKSHYIWGATAMITSEFLEVVEKARMV
ncbi:MAG: hypothetical protein A2275_14390 [Bacteroidetes bacterium RIFOXYA12_FULL_35_11]|nr:MAG: hypothetical protein A2X01_03310 [Bacteroidetes bacterium GWF2_35_48]OFY76029.1 MAG: hypothetical protein A2275_14390 [Bacteroidetes bacterium RIFOXYA12_FULL_35_11]OFY93762.1 MAG: hypothetical protein A2491_03980 [Bacteroidetes bacterium RIFOXYC12_FULL_35_7]OFY95954.1 MAG: hypothetical protein A2309_06175 [Bacteroidetes bacterium RIFOXYB2_FULL_35_7]HBX51451.1 coenzyme A pyrophosphatase [Bacteroidales bacterium]